MATKQISDEYIMTTLKFARKEIEVDEYRNQLTSLFKGYPTVLELLPIFFSEIDEAPQASELMTRPAGADLDAAPTMHHSMA